MTLIIVSKSSLHCLESAQAFFKPLGTWPPCTWKIRYRWFQGWGETHTTPSDCRNRAWIPLATQFFVLATLPPPLRSQRGFCQGFLPSFAHSLHPLLKEMFSLLTLVRIHGVSAEMKQFQHAWLCRGLSRCNLLWLYFRALQELIIGVINYLEFVSLKKVFCKEFPSSFLGKHSRKFHIPDIYVYWECFTGLFPAGVSWLFQGWPVAPCPRFPPGSETMVEKSPRSWFQGWCRVQCLLARWRVGREPGPWCQDLSPVSNTACTQAVVAPSDTKHLDWGGSLGAYSYCSFCNSCVILEDDVGEDEVGGLRACSWSGTEVWEPICVSVVQQLEQAWAWEQACDPVCDCWQRWSWMRRWRGLEAGDVTES